MGGIYLQVLLRPRQRSGHKSPFAVFPNIPLMKPKKRLIHGNLKSTYPGTILSPLPFLRQLSLANILKPIYILGNFSSVSLVHLLETTVTLEMKALCSFIMLEHITTAWYRDPAEDNHLVSNYCKDLKYLYCYVELNF